VCFSAIGSFATSAGLGLIGVASIATNRSKPRRMFAAIPLLFAAQQAAEGVVWSTLEDAAHAPLHRLAISAFLGIALMVWTTWLPMSLRLMEANGRRRRLLAALFWFGSLVAVYAALLLIAWPPTVRVTGHCLAYDHPKIRESWTTLLHLGGYVIPSILPFFVSTAPLARTIGVTLVASLVATFFVERDALTSVWCFFAAVLSGLVLVAVAREQRADVSRALVHAEA
jgi:uncharacterized protein DUF6629